MKSKKYIEVKTIFNKISFRYDFLNSLLSFGLHKFWKKKLINLLKPRNGEKWADLCCGTGDLAFLIYEKVSPNGLIIGIDSANEILDMAKKKSALVNNKFIKWELKVVLEMDEANNKFDAGPAKAIFIISVLGLAKYRESTGTGFAQPNPTNKIINEPNISKCASGFKVKRPAYLAVGSPNLLATHPCENS